MSCASGAIVNATGSRVPDGRAGRDQRSRPAGEPQDQAGVPVTMRTMEAARKVERASTERVGQLDPRLAPADGRDDALPDRLRVEAARPAGAGDSGLRCHRPGRDPVRSCRGRGGTRVDRQGEASGRDQAGGGTESEHERDAQPAARESGPTDRESGRNRPGVGAASPEVGS